MISLRKAYHVDLFGTSAWVILVVLFAEPICSPMRYLHAATWVGPTRIHGVVTPQRSPGYSPVVLLRLQDTLFTHPSQFHPSLCKHIRSKFTKTLIHSLAFQHTLHIHSSIFRHTLRIHLGPLGSHTYCIQPTYASSLLFQTHMFISHFHSSFYHTETHSNYHAQSAENIHTHTLGSNQAFVSANRTFSINSFVTLPFTLSPGLQLSTRPFILKDLYSHSCFSYTNRLHSPICSHRYSIHS